jgi:hypothetical protein
LLRRRPYIQNQQSMLICYHLRRPRQTLILALGRRKKESSSYQSVGLFISIFPDEGSENILVPLI